MACAVSELVGMALLTLQGNKSMNHGKVQARLKSQHAHPMVTVSGKQYLITQLPSILPEDSEKQLYML